MRQRYFSFSVFSTFVLFLLLYWLTANQMFSFDAITNALACEVNEPPRWFHSNHPLYPFVGMVWYRFERMLGYSGYAIYSLARLNSILMAAALALLVTILDRWSTRLLSISLVLFLGMTYSVWHYAVDGRAIGCSVFFSVLTIAYLSHLAQQERLSTRQASILGFLSLLTILMHGIAIFQIIPIFIWIVFREKRWLMALAYLFTVSIGLLMVYGGLFILVVEPFTKGSFLRWAIGYAGFNGLENSLHGGFWTRDYKELIFGAWMGWQRALFADLPTIFGRVFSTTLSAMVLGVFLYSFNRVFALSLPRKRLALTFIAWGGLVGIFLLFWSPGQEGFRLHVLVPWIVALGMCLPTHRMVAWGGMLLAGGLFYVNFTYSFYPASFIKNNTGYQLLNSIHSQVKPGDVVLSAQAGGIPGIEVLLPYFFPDLAGGSLTGRLMAFREKSLEPLKQHLIRKKLQNHDLYFAGDLFEEDIQDQIEGNYGLSENEIEIFLKGFIKGPNLPLPYGKKLFKMELATSSST